MKLRTGLVVIIVTVTVTTLRRDDHFDRHGLQELGVQIN
jgi:hypothetical protein